MRELIQAIDRLLTSCLGWQPAPKSPEGSSGDWLPPVLGPGDWSSSVMASRADCDAAWYFDRTSGT